MLELKQRAAWIAKRFAHMPTAEIKVLIEAKVGRWTAEFQAEQPTGSVGLL
jgi:hypothetical protein